MENQKRTRKPKTAQTVERRTEENQTPKYYSVSKKIIHQANPNDLKFKAKVISVKPMKFDCSLIDLRRIFKIDSTTQFIEFYENVLELKPDFIIN